MTSSSGSSLLSDTSCGPLSRQFKCQARILGNDAIQLPECSLYDDTLCDLCSSFVTGFLTRERKGPRFFSGPRGQHDFRHYSTTNRLMKSSKDGCKLCAAFVDLGVCQSGQEVSFFLKFTSDEAFSVHAETPGMDKFQPTEIGIFELVLAEDACECFKVLRRGKVLKYPSNSPTDGCFQQVTEWYNECVDHHRDCQRPSLPMPSRLLDLGQSDQNLFKIIEPKKSDKIQYLALSYCWGKESSIKTTKANISEMKKGIVFEVLPSVIQDAITICLMHNFQYLWIDRLCICQDDKDDWEREAQNLATIFGGCVFTIAALSSSCVSQPFLTPRGFLPVDIGRAVIPYGNRQDQVNIFIRKQPRLLDDEFNHSRWLQRGWTFQERVLTPAVLHFGRDQVMWECGTNHLRSETGEVSQDHNLVIRLTQRFVYSDDFGVKPLWPSIVESFSKRKFTFEKDRFYALAAVSRKLREEGLYEGRYVAGLWENDLEFQLIWTLETDGVRTRSVKTDRRFPTWSWLHQTAEVEWEITCTSPPTSALRKGPMFVFSDDTEASRSENETLVDRCMIELCGFVQTITKRTLISDSQPSVSKFPTTYLGLPGKESYMSLDQELSGSGPFYALRLLNSASRRDGARHYESVIYYLILERDALSEKEQIPRYLRVGVLGLLDMPDFHFVEPFPDVHCLNGSPLLTNGAWQNILLV